MAFSKIMNKDHIRKQCRSNFALSLSMTRAKHLAFWQQKHLTGMSLKKNKITFMKQQQCIYCFFFFFLRLQEAARTATFIYYSTQSEQINSSRRLLNLTIVQQKQKTKSPVLVVKIQCWISSVSICWSQISVLHETEVTLGGGRSGGSLCWLGNAWDRILCRNWQEYTEQLGRWWGIYVKLWIGPRSPSVPSVWADGLCLGLVSRRECPSLCVETGTSPGCGWHW